MVKSSLGSAPRVFGAEVLGNKAVKSRYYRISLRLNMSGSEAFGDFVPGQFAEIDLSRTALPNKEDIAEDLADSAGRQIILRRPFSFCGVEK